MITNLRLIKSQRRSRYWYEITLNEETNHLMMFYIDSEDGRVIAFDATGDFPEEQYDEFLHELSEIPTPFDKYGMSYGDLPFNAGMILESICKTVTRLID
jgi:hypothetical protein